MDLNDLRDPYLEQILGLLREARIDVQEANAKPLNTSAHYLIFCPSCDKEHADCICEVERGPDEMDLARDEAIRKSEQG